MVVGGRYSKQADQKIAKETIKYLNEQSVNTQWDNRNEESVAQTGSKGDKLCTHWRASNGGVA
jgi:hypothetical protein